MLISCFVAWKFFAINAPISAQQQTISHDTRSAVTNRVEAKVYRIRCANPLEIEDQLRRQYQNDAGFSLNIGPDAEPHVFRLAVLALPETQQEIEFVFRKQNALLPNQISTGHQDLPSNRPAYFSFDPHQAAPQHRTDIMHAALPNHPMPGNETMQTGFVTPTVPPQQPTVLQAPAPLPHAPNAKIAADANSRQPVQETRDSYAPNRVSPARIEQTLRSLLGNRFSEMAPNRYLLTSTDKNKVKKHCTLEIDRENGRFIISGDKILCDQLVHLIDSIDGSQTSEGRERNFLSIAKVKNETINQIFEANRSPKRLLSQADVLKSARQEDHSVVPGSSAPNPVPSTASPGLQFRHPSVPQNDPPPRIEFRKTEDDAAPQLLPGSSEHSSRQDQSEAAPKHLNPKRNPLIKLVGYQFQGEGFGDLGAGGGGIEMDGAERAGAPGMEVVSDFRYQILPDLDVLIIDATGAEVARFTDMIRQIEELSKIADPKIEVYQLKNVNCISLNWVIRQIYLDTGFFNTKQGMITIIPLINPNAILLVGWGHALDSMRSLIETLDKPVAGENNMLDIIRLKYASVQTVLPVLRGAFPRPPMQNSGFATRIEMFADARTNSIIVQAGPNDMKEIKRLVTKLDVLDVADGPKLLVKQFKLKHTLAADLAQIVTSTITPGTTGTSDKKLPALQILIDSEQGKKLDSGIMADVRVSAIPQTNTLVVTAPEKAMDLMEELISMLDVPASTAEIKVFQVLYGDAESLVATLRSLIPTQLEGQIGPQLPGAKGEESLVPIRFAVDKRTNSIFAAGSPSDLKIVEALLYSIDREDSQTRKQSVYMLKSMMASDVATAINSYLTSRRKIQQESPGTISAFQQIESEVILVPEAVSNSLIISATSRYYDEVIKLIQEIDQSPPQVVIQVLIGEVSLSNADEFGAEFGIQESLLFNRSTFSNIEKATRTITQTASDGTKTVIEEPFILNGTANPGWLFNENPSSSLGDGYNSTSANQAGNVGSQLLTNFATGRVGAETGFGGMVFSANSDAVSIMIRALQETNRLEVLSRPQIMAMNNQPAMIHVGQEVPRVQGTTVYDTREKTDIEDKEVGLMLTVTPAISPEGNVVMDVKAVKSKINSADGLVVGYSGSNPIRSPAIDIISTTTAISASDNETVVLGGLITKETQRIHRKVPLLGDIPIVGKLFSYEYNKCKRSELLIILTPRIVRNSCDAEEIKQIETARMSWCLCDISKIHGDIGAYNVVAEQPYYGDAAVMTPGRVDMDSLRPIDEVYSDDQMEYETKSSFVVHGPYLQPMPQNIPQNIQPGIQSNVTPPNVQPLKTPTQPQLAPPVTEKQNVSTSTGMKTAESNMNENESATSGSSKIPVPKLPTGFKKNNND